MPKRKNEVICVPVGSPAPKTDSLTISCDGKIPGATLELSHWEDNVTPADLYADTATQIALRFARARLDPENHTYDRFDKEGFLLLNNHYDQDGAISSWACLNPTEAIRLSSLIVPAAEAGDFGEWNTDDGVKIACALAAVEEVYKTGDDDRAAYREAHGLLPSLLDDFERTGGEGHKRLWRKGWDDAVRGYELLVSGAVGAGVSKGAGAIALVAEPRGEKVKRLSNYSVHRRMRDLGLADGQTGAATRILRSRASKEGNSWMYEYELPGHGWMQGPLVRKKVPVVDAEGLVRKLNEKQALVNGTLWKCGGSNGLGGGVNAVCCTTEFVDIPPSTIMESIMEIDEGASRYS